jgi:hypothetical protein
MSLKARAESNDPAKTLLARSGPAARTMAYVSAFPSHNFSSTAWPTCPFAPVMTIRVGITFPDQWNDRL